jgi:murein DD-endopeptidase MepM/ murein hydrolase activator NlpD
VPPFYVKPRHAAPLLKRKARSALVPAVLLASTGGALGGLAVVPAAADDSIRVTAAAASQPYELTALELAAQRSERREMRVSRERAAAEAERIAAEQAAAAQAAAEAAAAKAAAEAAAAEAAAKAAAEEAARPKFVRPGTGRLTSGFGRRWGRQHAGIDLAAGIGAPIRAVTAGTVTSVGTESGYGNAIRLKHDDGTETVYGHLSGFDVSEGQRVAAGEQIGREGNTGRSTGPHLHFEVRINGNPVNPLTWLRERGVEV